MVKSLFRMHFDRLTTFLNRLNPPPFAEVMLSIHEGNDCTRTVFAEETIATACELDEAEPKVTAMIAKGYDWIKLQTEGIRDGVLYIGVYNSHMLIGRSTTFIDVVGPPIKNPTETLLHREMAVYNWELH